MRLSFLQRALPVLVATGLFASLAGAPVAVAATTIVVSTGADAYANDGACSMSEAIIAANTDAATFGGAGECPAGSGTDTIRFGPLLSTVSIYGGTPDITSDLIIDGGGVVTLDLGGLGHVNKAAGAVTIKRVTIQNGSNGGIWNQAPGSLTVADTTVRGTAAGPGIYNAGTLTVLRSTLSGNAYGSASGGGLLNAIAGTASVTDSLITGNSAAGGGGIRNTGTLTLRRTTVSGNTATYSGGGLYSDGAATVSQSTLSGNHALGGSGGAIINSLDLALDNVTVVDNQSVTAGAIFSNGSLNALNVTIVGNTGGINNVGTASLTNAILSGNGTDVLGTALTTSHSQVGPLPGGVPLSTWLHLDLHRNGGPTETLALVNSPVNPFATTGDPGVCAIAPVAAVDQRGVTRPSGSCSEGAVQLERSAPTAGTPTSGIATDRLLTGSSIRALIGVSGNDNTGGSGIDHYVVARSVNSGTWATIVASQPPSGLVTTVTPGKSYRFRLKAVDHDGNASAWTYGTTFAPRLVQQTSSSVIYNGTWHTSSNTAFSGGSVRYSTASGASASIAATGRAFALVTTLAGSRGKAKVYVDGVYKSTIDLGSLVTYRYQAWSIRFSSSKTHTIRIVVLGTSGRPRIDIDAFAILK